MRGLWALALDASVEATAFSHDFSASLRTLQLAERGAPDIKTRCGGIPGERPVKLVTIANSGAHRPLREPNFAWRSRFSASADIRRRAA